MDFPILETERLLLGECETNDAEAQLVIYGDESMMNVSIRNPLGVEVMNIFSSGALDTHSLASGMYFVTITANGKSETLKLIKEYQRFFI